MVSLKIGYRFFKKRSRRVRSTSLFGIWIGGLLSLSQALHLFFVDLASMLGGFFVTCFCRIVVYDECNEEGCEGEHTEKPFSIRGHGVFLQITEEMY